jgi:WD40 repeat protein
MPFLTKGRRDYDASETCLGGIVMAEGRKQFPVRISRFISFSCLAFVIGLAVACGQTSPSSPTPTPVSAGTTFYTFREHTSNVIDVAWSPDSKYIASVSNDSTVPVWDASNGHVMLTYRGHAHNVNIAAWSPDGKQIASGDVDGIVRVWDAKTGTTHVIYQGHTSYIYAIAWSPDGKYIASGGAYSFVQVWDAKTGKLFLTYKGNALNASRQDLRGNDTLGEREWKSEEKEGMCGSPTHVTPVRSGNPYRAPSTV